MPAGILFWVIFFVALLFSGFAGYQAPPADRWRFWGTTLVIFILLALLGWKTFGPVIQ